MNTNLIVFCIVLLIVGLVLVVYKRGKQAFIREKKAAYLAALKSGNKTEALMAGRKYYSELRGGDLTIYDEQALANDLSTIK